MLSYIKSSLSSNLDKPKAKFSILIGLYFVLQVFIDNYYLMTDPKYQLFGVSVVTIIRYAYLLVLFIYFIKVYKSKQTLIAIGATAGAILIYTVIHLACRNALTMPSQINHYSVFGEITYIVSMSAPLILLIMVAFSDFSFKNLVITATIAAFCASLIIIVSNLTLTGLSSYLNIPIKASVLQWTQDHGYAFSEISTKGFFYFANQIGAFLCLCLPFIVYLGNEKKNYFPAVTLIVTTLATMMIGTRIAYFGTFMLLLIGVGYSIVISKINKSWNIIFLLTATICVLLMVGLYKYSPANSRIQNTRTIAQSEVEKKSAKGQKSSLQKSKSQKGELGDSLIQYQSSNGLEIITNDADSVNLTEEEIRQFKKGFTLNYETPDKKIRLLAEQRLPKTRINNHFYLNSYPYNLDCEFWLEATFLPPDLQMKNRYLENAMVNRIIQKGDGDWRVAFFGIGASRLEGIFNIEQDFIKQSKSLGLAGVVLFLFPYFFPVLLFLYKAKEKSLRGLQVIQILISALTLLFIGAVAFWSGNVMDGLLITLPLSIVAGVIVNELSTKGKVHII